MERGTRKASPARARIRQAPAQVPAPRNLYLGGGQGGFGNRDADRIQSGLSDCMRLRDVLFLEQRARTARSGMQGMDEGNSKQYRRN